MQLGMIGLGRMGANIVRRAMHGGHECVVFDVGAEAVAELEGEGAIGTASLDEFVAKLERPRVAWVMIPAGITGRVVDELAARLEPGDIIIDGGNSYYRDDIDRANALVAKGIHLPGCRHQRRHPRARARLLLDDRRRAGTCPPSRSDLRLDRARPPGGAAYPQPHR